MLQAGALDRRYRAIACIAAYYGVRRQLRDTIGHHGWTAQIGTAAHERLADLRAAAPRIHQALAPSTAPEGAALTLMDEAHDFYTSRQRQIAPHWVNQMTVESVHNLLEFDAVTYASLVAPTPLLVIHGTLDPNTPPRYAQEVYDTADEPKTLVWIETTNHIQLYDQPQVDQAATTPVGATPCCTCRACAPSSTPSPSAAGCPSPTSSTSRTVDHSTPRRRSMPRRCWSSSRGGPAPAGRPAPPSPTPADCGHSRLEPIPACGRRGQRRRRRSARVRPASTATSPRPSIDPPRQQQRRRGAVASMLRTFGPCRAKGSGRVPACSRRAPDDWRWPVGRAQRDARQVSAVAAA